MASGRNIYAFYRTSWLFLPVLVLLVLPFAQAFAQPIVNSIRVGDYQNRTRFVIDISQRTEFSWFMLADPYRIVMDMPEVNWGKNASKAPASRRITGFRLGLFRPGQTRVVIDLSGPATVKKAFRVPAKGKRGHRIVLDIVPVSRAVMLGEIRDRQKKLAAKPDRPAFKRTVTIGPPIKPRKPVKRRKTPKIPLIVIDPGHGGIDPGARGKSGIWEKRIVLLQARELRRQLESKGRYRVLLTRDGDIFIRLRERIAIAQKAGADLFLSLHADSIKNPRVSGASIYTLSEKASDREAAALAEKENKADIIAGIDLNDKSKAVARILIDLRQRMTKNESVRFAEMLVDEFQGKLPLLRKTRRFAGFAVLKAPDIPSVLIEMGYLSNRKDERLLRNKAHRRRVAAAIVRAVDSFFKRQQALNSP